MFVLVVEAGEEAAVEERDFFEEARHVVVRGFERRFVAEEGVIHVVLVDPLEAAAVAELASVKGHRERREEQVLEDRLVVGGVGARERIETFEDGFGGGGGEEFGGDEALFAGEPAEDDAR